MEPTQERAHRAWRSAERVKRVSDKLIGIGPFGVGLDGIIAWIPGANAVYSVGAASLLLYEAASAGASARTLAKMGAFLAADSMTSAVPVIGWAVDTLFPGHLMAANVLQKDIEARHGPSELPRAAWRKAGKPARTSPSR